MEPLETSTGFSEWNISNTTETPGLMYPYPNGFERFVIWTVALLIVFLNITVFMTLPRMKSLQAGTRIGMMSLAMSDFCMGTSLIVNHIYNAAFTHYQTLETDPFCIFVGIIVSISFGTSMMALAFLGLDRLIKMARPLHYPRIVTKRNARIVVVIIWCLIVGQMLLNFRDKTAIQTHYYEHAYVCINTWVGDKTYNLTFAFFTQFLPAATSLVSFIGIYCIATRRKVQSTQATASAQSQLRRDWRIFRTLAIMTLGFYIAIMPYFATIAVPELVQGKSLNPLSDFIACWLVASNSFWNAIIYILTMRSFRKALINLTTDFRIMIVSTSESTTSEVVTADDTRPAKCACFR